MMGWKVNMLDDTEYELKKFGELKPGDVIIGSGGKETTVVEVYDDHLPKEMFELEDDNGNIVKVSGNHLFYVETSLDKELHNERKRQGKKLFKNVDKKVIESFVEAAEAIYEDYDSYQVETTIRDMLNLASLSHNRDAQLAFIRIAESIGHISESNLVIDELDSEQKIIDKVFMYDLNLFSQQVLSLTGRKEFTKKYPLIVGRVVTAKKMSELLEDFDVYIPSLEENDSN